MSPATPEREAPCRHSESDGIALRDGLNEQIGDLFTNEDMDRAYASGREDGLREASNAFDRLVPEEEADLYEWWVERVADAIHETCRNEWRATVLAKPARFLTQHGSDHHFGMAHDLVRRLYLATIENEARVALLDELEAAVNGLPQPTLGLAGGVNRASVLALIQQHRETT